MINPSILNKKQSIIKILIKNILAFKRIIAIIAIKMTEYVFCSDFISLSKEGNKRNSPNHKIVMIINIKFNLEITSSREL